MGFDGVSPYRFGLRGLKGQKWSEKRLGFSQKSRRFFGKISGVNVIFPKISGYFFRRQVQIKSNQSGWTATMPGQARNMRKLFIMNDLLIFRPSSRSNPVKPGQTSFQSAKVFPHSKTLRAISSSSEHAAAPSPWCRVIGCAMSCKSSILIWMCMY